jgi:hypothetical protein
MRNRSSIKSCFNDLFRLQNTLSRTLSLLERPLVTLAGRLFG